MSTICNRALAADFLDERRVFFWRDTPWEINGKRF
jgi:hypothetical protein